MESLLSLVVDLYLDTMISSHGPRLARRLGLDLRLTCYVGLGKYKTAEGLNI